jgi:hypothetical protein
MKRCEGEQRPKSPTVFLSPQAKSVSWRCIDEWTRGTGGEVTGRPRRGDGVMRENSSARAAVDAEFAVSFRVIAVWRK